MIKPEWKKEIGRLLATANEPKEVNQLLEALLTPSEHEEIVRRWQIVKGLIEGKTQRTVRDDLSISIATVTRGARELKYGSGILKKFYDRLCERK